MSLLGSPFQRKVSTADNITVEAGTDVLIETGSSKTVTLPLARNCTLEDGNNIVRVVADGNNLTLAVQTGDTFANSGDTTTITITNGAVAYCESDGLNQWIVTGRTS